MKLAFCNDCDLMSWGGYQAVHGYFESINIQVGDSFWLFDPSGSDMALFTHDIHHKGPKHDELLDEIKHGRIDVIHSLGSFGERFNKGYKPSRRLAAEGLEYLAKHAKVPKIWTNHGDVNNTQNIGGRFALPHHKGDAPESDTFLLDLLIDHGIEYYWIETSGGLTRELTPFKIVSKDKSRSGDLIKRFTRLYSSRIEWSPNGENLSHQIFPEDLMTLKAFKQNAILYTHWGCAHQGKWAYTPNGNPLSDESIQALRRLSDLQIAGELEVVRLYDLLKEEDSRSIADEAQRIGSYVVSSEVESQDKFYYNQYHKWGIPYFKQRIDRLDVSGSRALDAGCGAGQWALALTDKFEEVDGIDIGDKAYSLLQNISTRIPDSSIHFKQGKIEDLPYKDESYEFVLCHGVIMFTDVTKSLGEIYRVLKPGGKAYICLNADGWYQYCCDVKFKDNYSYIAMHVAPIWHSFFVRAGGRASFEMMLLSRIVQRAIYRPYLEIEIARDLVKYISGKYLHNKYQEVVNSYSDTIVVFLAAFIKEYFGYLSSIEINSLKGRSCFTVSRFSQKLNAYFTNIKYPMVKNINKYNYEEVIRQVARYHITDNIESNRTYLPDEFFAICDLLGFKEYMWGAEGSLGAGNSVKPIYEENYRGLTSVWECLVTK